MGFEEMDVGTIWQDGSFVGWDDATIHVLSHGLHYGTGIFEGVRCYDTADGPAIFRWDEHLERFYQSAKPYEMTIPFIVLHPPGGVLRLRLVGRLPRRQPGERGDRCVALGDLPR
jgi:hypothetical protein